MGKAFCVTTQVTPEASPVCRHPTLFATRHAGCQEWQDVLPKWSTGPAVVKNSNQHGDPTSASIHCRVEVVGAQDTGLFLSGHLLSLFFPSTESNLWMPSSLGVWQPWFFSIVLNLLFMVGWGTRTAYGLKPLELRLLKLNQMSRLS